MEGMDSTVMGAGMGGGVGGVNNMGATNYVGGIGGTSNTSAGQYGGTGAMGSSMYDTAKMEKRDERREGKDGKEGKEGKEGREDMKEGSDRSDRKDDRNEGKEVKDEKNDRREDRKDDRIDRNKLDSDKSKVDSYDNSEAANERLRVRKEKSLKKDMLAFNITLSHMPDRHLINMSSESVVKVGNVKERKVDIMALRLFLKQSNRKIQKFADTYEENITTLKESMKDIRQNRKDKNDDINSNMMATLKIKKAQTVESLRFTPGSPRKIS